MRMRPPSPAAALLAVLFVIAGGHRLLSVSGRDNLSTAPAAAPARTLPDHAASHAAEPCDHDPPGHARGRDRLCVPRGSSSGIARGDFNGDGIGDLAIGVPFEDVAGVQDAGGVNIIYGSPSGLHADAGPSDQFLGYAQTNGRAGSALAAGDFDGDGFSDLAIGAPFDDAPSAPAGDGSVRAIPFLTSTVRDGSSNTIDVGETLPVSTSQAAVQDAGRVHVFFGSPAGLDKSSWVALTIFDATGQTPRSLDEFGASLAWGDFDGDGFGDLAVGAPGFQFHAGAVAVLYGSTLRFRVNALVQRNRLFTQNSDGIPDVSEPGDRFGAALAAGDFGLPVGVSDLAVGAPGEDLTVTTFSGRTQVTTTVRDAGAVHVLYGDNTSSPAGLSATNTQIWTQNSRQIEGEGEILDVSEEGDAFGAALASFGLGSSDLAIGVPGEDVGASVDAGAVAVVYFNFGSGRLSFPGNQLWTQGGDGMSGEPEAGDAFGSALAGGDFNGDTLKDLAIGAPGETLNELTSSPLSNAGAVHVLYYQSLGTGLHAMAGPGNQFWTQGSGGLLDRAAPGERFGSALTAWDFGNGFLADLAVGVPFQSLRVAATGAVHVIYGDNTSFTPGLGSAGNQVWTQNSANIEGVAEAGDQFGRALY